MKQASIDTPIIESPTFNKAKTAFSSKTAKIAHSLHAEGYAIIDFPDDQIEERAERIKNSLQDRFDLNSWASIGWKNGESLRLTDEWMSNEDIRSIATNQDVIDLLSELYGRPAFPFQTLNFPVGTQQAVHSDTMHFNTIPERWMCGVWVALEDIDEDNGPLVYYPGTHNWPILWGEHLGLNLATTAKVGQHLFDPAWQKKIEDTGVKPTYLRCKKGQALIWLSNLLHGGAKQKDPNRTRWSQVTHYYFEGCTYWRPYASNLSTGDIFTFSPPNITTGKLYSVSERVKSLLPIDFNSGKYKALNPDLSALSDAHAMEHWVLNGKHENRRYSE